eukprot:6437139-Ditylum_brightwellii.AAC.1
MLYLDHRLVNRNGIPIKIVWAHYHDMLIQNQNRVFNCDFDDLLKEGSGQHLLFPAKKGGVDASITTAMLRYRDELSTCCAIGDHCEQGMNLRWDNINNQQSSVKVPFEAKPIDVCQPKDWVN